MIGVRRVYMCAFMSTLLEDGQLTLATGLLSACISWLYSDKLGVFMLVAETLYGTGPPGSLALWKAAC